MKLTAKARYAVIAITDIAVSAKNGDAVSLSDISVRQDISLSFLEQLFGKLRKAGIVESVRGASGGYVLARASADISIGNVMRAVDEEVQTKRCDDNGLGCTTKGAKCLSHDLWQAMEDHIEGFFTATSIQDVIDQRFPQICPDLAQEISSKTEATTRGVEGLDPTGNISRGAEGLDPKGNISRGAEGLDPKGNISRGAEGLDPTGNISRGAEGLDPKGNISRGAEGLAPKGNI